MKKIISVFLALIVAGTLLVGCGDNKKDDTSNESSNETAMLSQNEKDSYKEKVKEALKGFDVNDIDILTQNETGKPIISIQASFGSTKEKAGKKEVEKYIDNIVKKIKPISELYSITILSKDSQVIAMAGNEENGKIEFMK